MTPTEQKAFDAAYADAVKQSRPGTIRDIARLCYESAITAANAVEPNFSDQATIAGLEASTGHLSALVNEQLLLLEEVNENLGVDGLGAELDDDQSPTIAKVRAHLAAMAPPTRPAVQPQPMAYAVFSSNGNIRIWGHSPDVVKRIKAEFGSSLIALYAHPQATEPAWRPIESAPRNGTPILLATDGGIVFVGKLNKHLQLWVDDEGRERFRTVTYWMPLPAAPEAKQ